MTLGQRIQELRKARDLSQEALGEILGVSRQAISRWEMDGAVPEVDKLIQMAKLFGVSLNDLLRVEEPAAPEEENAEASVPGGAAGAQKRRHAGVVLPILALLAVVLGLVAFTVSFGRRTGALQDELVRLEHRIDQLEQSASGLDPTAPLVSTFDFEWTGGQLELDLVPFQRPDGLTVSFTAGGASAEGAEGANGHYTAAIPLDRENREVTVTATLSDGTRRYTQALVRISHMDESGYSWVSLWEEPG